MLSAYNLTRTSLPSNKSAVRQTHRQTDRQTDRHCPRQRRTDGRRTTGLVAKRRRRRWCFVVSRLTNGDSVQGYDRVRCRTSSAVERRIHQHTVCLLIFSLRPVCRSNPIFATLEQRRRRSGDQEWRRHILAVSNLLRLSGRRIVSARTSVLSRLDCPAPESATYPLSAVMAFSRRPLFRHVVSHSGVATRSRHPPLGTRVSPCATAQLSLRRPRRWFKTG